MDLSLQTPSTTRITAFREARSGSAIGLIILPAHRRICARAALDRWKLVKQTFPRKESERKFTRQIVQSVYQGRLVLAG